MARLGSWAAERRVAVACSGGADSMALTLLAASWGQPLALIVDHGLRPESANEAVLTQQRLAARGIPARILTLRGLKRGPGLAARARAARYASLEQACREAGLLDLLLGHHLRDQAETLLMRQRAASGPAGLAAMAPVSETRALRLVRPLLTIPPARLRATLQAAGLDWAEDPSNTDPATLRARLRAELAGGPDIAALAEQAAEAAAARDTAEAAIATVLARRARIFPEGFAQLSPGPLPAAALAALIRMVTGAAYPVRAAQLRALAADPRPATLGGARLIPAGRLGEGLLCVREEAAMAPPIPATPGVLWDRRFRLSWDAAPSPGTTLGALGPDAAALRDLSPLPAAILRGLPALRVNTALVAVPHIGYRLPEFPAWGIGFCPATPAAGAPFRARGDAEEPSGPHVASEALPAPSAGGV
jgi:tRNA(Ile)-lysidine synthase